MNPLSLSLGLRRRCLQPLLLIEDAASSFIRLEEKAFPSSSFDVGCGVLFHWSGRGGVLSPFFHRSGREGVSILLFWWRMQRHNFCLER